MQEITENQLTRISKFLSLVLRHKPSEIGVTLDGGGWAVVAELLEKMPGLTREILDRIVTEDRKQRYRYSADKVMIRAVQGHSLEIDLGLEPIVPPDVLYHGTAERFCASIQSAGLLKMNRQFVHLSADRETALMVGKRHGKPLVYMVDSNRMHQDGKVFYVAENGVWLTEKVETIYLMADPSI